MIRRRRLRALMLGAVVALGGVGSAGAASPVGSAGVPAAAAPVVDVAPWLARKPLNIAHAGGDLESPHETMYAYRQAVAAGADMLEMDLRLSRDRQLMVIHDDTLDRTTNATGAVRGRTDSQRQRPSRRS